jgi:NAD-dependent deacetylase
MDEKIELIAERIKASKNLIVFTGAGISTESGIPDYRSQGGIWDKFRPVYFDEFMSSRQARIRYWEQRMDMEKSLCTAKPNEGHMSIAGLHELGYLNTLITQNIDGLHEASGIPGEKIIELHGNTRRVRCMSCKRLISWQEAEAMFKSGDKAPECSCGGYFKPDTVSFGQTMPVEETKMAVKLSSKSDMFMVIGSTLLVQPASLMPGYAKAAGAFLVIVNLSETPYDGSCNVLIREKAGDVLKQILNRVKSG